MGGMNTPENVTTSLSDHLLLTKETTLALSPDSAAVLGIRTPEELRGVATSIAIAAANHVRQERRAFIGLDGRVSIANTKSSVVDPVTAVDRSSEDVIRALLRQAAPEDHVFGEENGGQLARDAVTWIVDPIDGTVNFVYGIPASAVSIAATVNGVPIAAAVVDIPRGYVFSACIGGPALCTPREQDAPMGTEAESIVLNQHTELTDMSLALVGTGFAYDASRRARQATLLMDLLPRVRDIRRIGSAALDLCAVASGKFDAYFEHGLGPWDYAGGALIAARSGAVVYMPRLTATSRDGVGVLASAPGVSQELAGHTISIRMQSVS